MTGATPPGPGAPPPAFVAVDWGTTRLRATLVGPGGAVLAAADSEAGVQSVPPGGFPAALDAACGAWLGDHSGLPVLMSGMVGSRGGWIEAPYAPCPAGPADLAARLVAVPGTPRRALIVPGVDVRWPDGARDVMRGEEVQALGTGVADGLVVLPGTHGKWVEMRGGRIHAFATFVTGELFAAVSNSFVGRLAAEPHDDAAGGEMAARAPDAPGGLTRALFQARARALAGDLAPAGVRPYLSRLLVEAEVAGAVELFGAPDLVHLVSGEPQRSAYRAALLRRGIAVADHDTPTATLAGLRAVMAAASPPS